MQNLEIGTDLFICDECSSNLQEAFSFKSNCVEMENTVYNYTNDGQVQLSLEKITGLKDLEINDKIVKDCKICRICLNVAKPLTYMKIDESISPLVLEMMQNFLPEVVSKMLLLC